MQHSLQWDIFCQVIDNHGDLGLCWRLARQLSSAGHRVRLWVDDASALAWMAPANAMSQAASQGGGGAIDLHAWQDATQAAALADLPPADVWVEAFGCELPDAFVAHRVASPAPPPVWINLEYLSAEAWVPRLHGLPSPVMSGPARGWTKRFFYPGFTPATGGLLREADLAARQQAFAGHDRSAWRARHAPNLAAEGRLISLFCYEPPALPQLVAQLAGTPDHLLVTPGRPLAAVQSALAEGSAAPNWSPLGYTTQDGFDQMLWACDLNLVRGEDSLVRALWAGQPLVWHIYPQHDQAHHPKLEAFLDWLQAPESLRRFHRVWNGLEESDLPPLDAATLAQWRLCVQAARQRLEQQDDLVRQLIQSAAAWATAPGQGTARLE